MCSHNNNDEIVEDSLQVSQNIVARLNHNMSQSSFDPLLDDIRYQIKVNSSRLVYGCRTFMWYYFYTVFVPFRTFFYLSFYAQEMSSIKPRGLLFVIVTKSDVLCVLAETDKKRQRTDSTESAGRGGNREACTLFVSNLDFKSVYESSYRLTLCRLTLLSIIYVW